MVLLTLQLKCKSLTVKHQGISNFAIKIRNTTIDIAIDITKKHKMMIRDTYGANTPPVQRRPRGVR